MSEVSLQSMQFFGAKPAAPKPKLDMTTFLRLLTVQLANQNPLEPMSDRDFFAQMAQLGQVQGMDTMSQQLGAVQVSGMIGKTVTAFRPSGPGSGLNQEIAGVVMGMQVKNGKQMLMLQEANGGIAEVELANVTRIGPAPDTTTPHFNNLASQLGALQATSLIGRNIEAEIRTTVNGQTTVQSVKGQVHSLVVERGATLLRIKTDGGMVNVRMDQLRSVT